MPQIDFTPAKPLIILHQPYKGRRGWCIRIFLPGAAEGQEERIFTTKEDPSRTWGEVKESLERKGLWVVEGT